MQRVACLSILICAPLLVGPLTTWRYTIPSEPGDCGGAALAVAPLASGEVLVAGEVDDLPVVAKLSVGDGAEIWRTDPGNAPGASLLATPSGQVFAAGSLYSSFEVDLLDPEFGYGVLWFSPGEGEARAMAWDGADTIAVGGVVWYENDTQETQYDFAVTSLHATALADRWTALVNGTAGRGVGAYAVWQRANDVAFDSAGDVVAAGRLMNEDTLFDFSAVKLARQDGRPLWQLSLDGPSDEYAQCSPFGGAYLTDSADAVAVDPNDDVVLAGHFSVSWECVTTGSTTSLVTSAAFVVMKREGADGDEVWLAQLPDGNANDVVVDGAGDVYAGGTLSGQAAVVKLAGDTGDPIWSTPLFPGTIEAIVLDDAGRIFAAGESEGQLAVAALGADNGQEIWSEISTAPGDCFSRGARAIALAGQGAEERVIAAGTIGADFAVLALDASSGYVPEPSRAIGAAASLLALAALGRASGARRR